MSQKLRQAAPALQRAKNSSSLTDTMMESHDRTKVWVLVALCLFLVIGGYFVTNWLISPRPVFRGAAPDQPEVPLLAPVAQPAIQEYKEIAQYTQGKPLPESPSYDVYFDARDPDEHVRGNPNTPVRMVEYAGLSSVYTQVIQEQLVSFLEQNKDRMHWVFRNYPKTDNSNDYRSALAAECLNAQLGNDVYWRYLDTLLYSIGSQYPLNDLLTKAGSLGADTAALQTCIENKEFMNHILDDKRTANIDSKIFVQPAFVFYNLKSHEMRIVEGINTMEYMQAVLDEVAKVR